MPSVTCIPGPTARQMPPSPTSTDVAATLCRNNARIRNLTKSANTARRALRHISTPSIDRSGGADTRALSMARQPRGLPTSHDLRRNACWERLPQAGHEAQVLISAPGAGHTPKYASVFTSSQDGQVCDVCLALDKHLCDLLPGHDPRGQASATRHCASCQGQPR